MKRYAMVGIPAGKDVSDFRETVTCYLPRNYSVTKTVTASLQCRYIVIEGEDNHGWTLDGYVIPRLASGLIHAEEVSEGET